MSHFSTVSAKELCFECFHPCACGRGVFTCVRGGWVHRYGGGSPLHEVQSPGEACLSELTGGGGAFQRVSVQLSHTGRVTLLQVKENNTILLIC